MAKNPAGFVKPKSQFINSLKFQPCNPMGAIWKKGPGKPSYLYGRSNLWKRQKALAKVLGVYS